MNHVSNCHSWALGQCDHDEMAGEREEKQWLKPSSKPFKELEKQVLDKRLLRTFPYYVTCQTTSDLEVFNNHLLMYAPKRNASSYSVYACRSQLAAIDYSMHMGRVQLTDKEGKPRWRRAYSKAANNWTVHPVMEPKKYSYIPELLSQIATKYLSKEDTLRSYVKLNEKDPRRISKHIASVSPKPTAKLAEEFVSRIKKKK